MANEPGSYGRHRGNYMTLEQENRVLRLMLATYASAFLEHELLIDDKTCIEPDYDIDYYNDSLEQITAKLFKRPVESFVNAS